MKRNTAFILLGSEAILCLLLGLLWPRELSPLSLLSQPFQAIGNGVYSLVTSLIRQLAVLLPAAYLLSLTGVLRNVWFSFPIAEVASLLVSALLLYKTYKTKIHPMYTERN